MSRQLAQAFRSTRIVRPNICPSFCCPGSRSTFASRIYSSLAKGVSTDRNSEVDQREAYLEGSSQNRIQIRSIGGRLNESDGPKPKQEEDGLDTGDNGKYLENTSVVSSGESSFDQELPAQHRSTAERKPIILQSLEDPPSSPVAALANRPSKASASLDSSTHLNSDKDQYDSDILESTVLLGSQGHDAEQLQQPLKTHFLDALSARNAIDLAQGPKRNARQKALVHDEARSKEISSFDWTVPLLKLQNTLLEQKTKIPRESPSYIAIAELGKKDLVDNDYIAIPVSSIPVPEVWTKASFAQYVHDLCRSRMPRQVRRIIHSEEPGSHQEMVCRRLEVIFVPENAGLVSFTALESAMRFYYRFGLLSSVQNLYFYVRKIGYPFPDGIIDLILRHAAKDKDLHNFTSMLHGALAQGFVPSEMTWASLSMSLLSDESRKTVLDTMHKYHLLTEKATRKDMAFVELEMNLSSLSDLSNIKTYIHRMNTRYGQDWFTIKSANVLLKELCKSPPGKPVTSFLKLMSRHGCLPNIDSMNILLQRCFHVTDLKAAIMALDLFIDHYRIVPDQRSYELLFRTAWNSRHANSCRVLWTAACVHGRVTHTMRQLIKTSLLRPMPPSISHAWHRWNWQAGRLIVGNDPTKRYRTGMQSTTPSTTPSTANTEQSIPLSIEDNKTQGEKTRYAEALIQPDEALYLHFYFSLDSLRKSLQSAYSRDQRAKTTGSNTSSLYRQRKSIIKVRLDERYDLVSKNLGEGRE